MWLHVALCLKLLSNKSMSYLPSKLEGNPGSIVQDLPNRPPPCASFLFAEAVGFDQLTAMLCLTLLLLGSVSNQLFVLAAML